MYYKFDVDDKMAQQFTALGIDFEHLLREARIPPRAFGHSKYLLTVDQFKRLATAMDKLVDWANLVAISKVDTAESFIPELFAGLCAENGLACVQRIARYKKIVAPIEISIQETVDSVSIQYGYQDGSYVPSIIYKHPQVTILSIIRKGSGCEEIKPIKVVGSEAYHENTIDYFGVTPEVVEEGNNLIFAMEDLKRPFITKNNRMWDYLERELNQRLREIEVDQSFSATVRKTLFELLPSGVSDADKISHELGVSKRTLQRRLKEESTSFNEQLNHTRELMVRNYLKMDMTLDEIAFLVNYSDAKSLSRAFKVWTGMSLSAYRDKEAIT